MRGLIASKFSSRRVQAVAAMALFALLAFFFSATRSTEEFGPSTDIKTRAAALAERMSKTDIAHKDSDRDGLSDWEETLYRTDPNSPDSDRDGITDGEEIAGGTNPLAPDDTRKNAVPPESPPKNSRELAVERFANDIDMRYRRVEALAEGNLSLSLLQNFFSDTRIQELEEEKQDQALQELLKVIFLPIYEKLPRFAADSVADDILIVSESDDTNSLIRYFNAVAAIYEKILSPLKGEEDRIIENANAGDENALKKLSRERAVLEKAQKEFFKIPVPRAALALHKREVWLTQNDIAQIKLLEHANIDDPIYIIFLMDIRRGLQNSIARFHATEVSAWLKERNITFTAGRPARLLYQSP